MKAIGWIRTNPPAQDRIVIPSPVIVQPRLRIKLLARKPVHRHLAGAAFFHPRFSVGEVLQMLVHRSRIVGDEAAAPEMIAVIEELKLLYRRIGGRSCRTAVGSRQSSVDPLLRA